MLRLENLYDPDIRRGHGSHSSLRVTATRFVFHSFRSYRADRDNRHMNTHKHQHQYRRDFSSTIVPRDVMTIRS